MARLLGFLSALAVVASFAGACTVREPTEDTYFERSISPTLTTSCARGPTGAGCHVADARGYAFGNLDVSTFDQLAKRRDLLATYGPYGQSGLLLKVVPPLQLELRAFDGTTQTITTDVRHTGGSVLDPASSGYRTLSRWIEAGATKNNTGKTSSQYASLTCTVHAPSSTHDIGVDPPGADYGRYRDDIHPMLLARCGAGNCHGSPANELQLACGSSPEEVRASYWAAVDYLATAPEQSELLRRPLAPAAGGTFHEGGAIFDSPRDADYQKLLGWAQAHGPLETTGLGEGFTFFARRVQPALVRKGCMQMQCHSPSIFHDYRLRGGASGSFSLTATRKNYALSLAQLALESDDVRASRLVRKNLFRPDQAQGGDGIVHRGGALFEDFAGGVATGDKCDKANHDYENGSLDSIPAFCIVREWSRRERAARPLAPLGGVVYVARDLPRGAGGLLDFDTYAPGSDLRIANVAAGADGTLTASADRSVMTACALTPATADVKRPQVSWDGSKIAFAARTSSAEPLRIYEMKSDGTSCAPITELGAHPASANGLLVHDFDPAYSPPVAGGPSALVFASTRGNLDGAAYDYSGPQRTPADPSRPNANLYVWERDPKAEDKRRIRQLTYLLNTERAPAFMADGRVIFTVEKRMPGFSQIALRRINLDGGDYHPLFGQRGSLGYREVSQVVHLADKNFAAVFADHGTPHRGGALGVFNRSMGVDLGSPDPADYPADPTVSDPAAPASPNPAFFFHSLRVPDPSATGRASGATSGLYASPAALPDGRILASWGAAASAGAFDGDYDVYVVDSASGARTRLLGTAGKADVEAVAIYGRPVREPYRSVASEPNAYALDESRPNADVLMHDASIILSLMMQNTPTGRVVDRDLRSFDLLEDLPPPLDVKTMAAGGSFVAHDAFGDVYVRRRRLGTVPVGADGSAHYQVTGGLPLVIALPQTPMSSARSLPRVLSEHVMFTPGESVHEGLRRGAFDGFCGGCHGSTSGRPDEAALQPDVLSRASDTAAFREAPVDLGTTPAQRGPILGP
jgi:hypothetical protein